MDKELLKEIAVEVEQALDSDVLSDVLDEDYEIFLDFVAEVAHRYHMRMTSRGLADFSDEEIRQESLGRKYLAWKEEHGQKVRER